MKPKELIRDQAVAAGWVCRADGNVLVLGRDGCSNLRLSIASNGRTRTTLDPSAHNEATEKSELAILRHALRAVSPEYASRATATAAEDAKIAERCKLLARGREPALRYSLDGGKGFAWALTPVEGYLPEEPRVTFVGLMEKARELAIEQLHSQNLKSPLARALAIKLSFPARYVLPKEVPFGAGKVDVHSFSDRALVRVLATSLLDRGFPLDLLVSAFGCPVVGGATLEDLLGPHQLVEKSSCYPIKGEPHLWVCDREDGGGHAILEDYSPRSEHLYHIAKEMYGVSPNEKIRPHREIRALRAPPARAHALPGDLYEALCELAKTEPGLIVSKFAAKLSSELGYLKIHFSGTSEGGVDVYATRGGEPSTLGDAASTLLSMVINQSGPGVRDVLLRYVPALELASVRRVEGPPTTTVVVDGEVLPVAFSRKGCLYLDNGAPTPRALPEELVSALSALLPEYDCQLRISEDKMRAEFGSEYMRLVVTASVVGVQVHATSHGEVLPDLPPAALYALTTLRSAGKSHMLDTVLQRHLPEPSPRGEGVVVAHDNAPFVFRENVCMPAAFRFGRHNIAEEPELLAKRHPTIPPVSFLRGLETTLNSPQRISLQPLQGTLLFSLSGGAGFGPLTVCLHEDGTLYDEQGRPATDWEKFRLHVDFRHYALRKFDVRCDPLAVRVGTSTIRVDPDRLPESLAFPSGDLKEFLENQITSVAEALWEKGWVLQVLKSRANAINSEIEVEPDKVVWAGAELLLNQRLTPPAQDHRESIQSYLYSKLVLGRDPASGRTRVITSGWSEGRSCEGTWRRQLFFAEGRWYAHIAQVDDTTRAEQRAHEMLMMDDSSRDQICELLPERSEAKAKAVECRDRLRSMPRAVQDAYLYLLDSVPGSSLTRNLCLYTPDCIIPWSGQASSGGTEAERLIRSLPPEILDNLPEWKERVQVEPPLVEIPLSSPSFLDHANVPVGAPFPVAAPEPVVPPPTPPEPEPEPTPSPEPAVAAAMLVVFREDAHQAKLRVAGRQLAKTVATPLSAATGVRFESEVAQGILQVGLSLALPQVHRGEMSQALSKEMRLDGLAALGDEIADLLMGPVRQVLRDLVAPQPDVPDAQEPPQLGDKSQTDPVIESSEDTSRETV